MPNISPKPNVSNPLLIRPDWIAGEPRDATKLWLDKNENVDPHLASIVQSVVANLPAQIYQTYPETSSLYRKLGLYNGLSPKSLFVSAGSDGVIRAVFEAYVEPGDIVIHTAPTFAMYTVYGRMYGADCRPLCYLKSNKGPMLCSKDVIAAIRAEKPKLICLPNPDSPSGTVFSITSMQAIIEEARESNSLVLVDEAYHPFHVDSVLPWVQEYDHLIVTRSTGKAWGLAGFRIGYGAACPEIAMNLHKIRPMYETSAVAAAVFEKMLDFKDEMMASVSRLEAGKTHFLNEMVEMGFQTLDGKGNFLHVSFGGSAAAIHDALQPLVYYRKDFEEPCLQGYSRFSSATIEQFEPIIRCIQKTIMSVGKRIE